MEPKKARLAITMTAIAAVLVIAVCLFFLLGPELGSGKSTTKKPNAAVAPAAQVVQPKPTEAPKEKVENPDFSWVILEFPGPDNLKGAADELVKPKIDNYLSAYELMYVYPEFVDEDEDEEIEFAYLLYAPEKKLYSRHVIIELPRYTPVLAIAKQNGYTLCLVQPGVVGWVRTELLEYTDIYIVN